MPIVWRGTLAMRRYPRLLRLLIRLAYTRLILLVDAVRFLVRSKNSKSPFQQRLLPSTWKGWGQIADSGRHPLGVMAFSPRDGRVNPQRFQPLPVRSRVLERVIDRKPLGRCRRQESIVCRHEHRYGQLLTRDGLADS